MNTKAIDTIVESMTSNEKIVPIQRVQTNHRIKLAEFWNIKEGDRVLEIGCGQGDTTVVLAYFAGEGGFVHGIDIGPSTYGTPVSLGESAAHIKKSTLGKQIKMDFAVDILSPEVDFPENAFDCIVLSHCSWYLKSFEEFSKLLEKSRRWGKKLCLAEWDTRIQTMEQYPHLLSVLIQAQYEAFKENSNSNVRTLFTPDDMKRVVEDAGWCIGNDTTIFSSDLQDGHWEVDKVMTEWDAEIRDIGHLPMKVRELVQSEVRMLEDIIKKNKVKPLSVYAFVAK